MFFEMATAAFIEGAAGAAGGASAKWAIQKFKEWLQGPDFDPGAFEPVGGGRATRSAFGAMHHFHRQPQVSFPSFGRAQFQAISQRVSGAFLPQTTAPLWGVDLSGVWAPPNDPMSATFIRQYGPYLNIVKPDAQNPPYYAEGVINPTTGYVFFTGQYVPGPPAGFSGHIRSDWTLSGEFAKQTPFGQLVTIPLTLMRLQ